VAFLDGYLVFLRPETAQFYWSGLYALTFNGADFATAEGSPERLRALLASHRALWLWGTRRTEVWVNTGAAPPASPFARLEGAFLEHGIAAPHSARRLGEAVAWLAADERGQGMVVLAQGFTPLRISTHAVEHALATYPTIADAVAYTYMQEGHLFYVLTFPSGNATWCYDLSTQLWHERASLDPTTGTLGRHRSTCYTSAFNTPLVGDYADGRIYQLDLDTYSDDGAALRTEVIFPPLLEHGLTKTILQGDTSSHQRLLHRRFQLDVEVGVGLDGSGQGSDPQWMVSWSDDFGHTWKPERTVSGGKVGEYRRRMQLWRLGQARDRRYKVAITDPVKRALLGAFVDVEVCAS
jgi:hypothetical protein